MQWMSHGCPLERWIGQESETSLVSEGGMSNDHSMNVHWTGRTFDFDGKLGHE